MTAPLTERRRTGLDIALGILVILAGLFVLGNAALATEISVLVLGWITLLCGLILLVCAFFRIRSGGFWSAAIGGAILLALGLFAVRNPLLGALGLTVLAGALFLVTGLVRLFVAPLDPSARTLLIISGIISVGLGLFVLFNLMAATLTLLGILLGIQVVLEGVTLLLFGRLHPTGKPDPAVAAPQEG